MFVINTEALVNLLGLVQSDSDSSHMGIVPFGKAMCRSDVFIVLCFLLSKVVLVFFEKVFIAIYPLIFT